MSNRTGIPTFYRLLLLLTLASAIPGSSSGKGIIIALGATEDTRQAIAIEYDSVDRHRSVVNYTTASRKSGRIPAQQLIGIVEFMDLSSASVASSAEIAALEKRMEHLGILSEKYPNTRLPISQELKRLDLVLQMIRENDRVLSKGRWISRAKFVALQKEKEASNVVVRGYTYKNAKIVGISEKGVKIAHAAGVSVVPLEELNEHALDVLKRSDTKGTMPSGREQIQQAISKEAAKVRAQLAEKKRLAEESQRAEAEAIKTLDQAMKLVGEVSKIEVERKLDWSDFTSVRTLVPKALEIYQVREFGSKVTILATVETRFGSTGSAWMRTREMGKIPVKMENGFSDDIRLLVEVSAVDLRAAYEIMKPHSALIERKAKEESKTAKRGNGRELRFRMMRSVLAELKTSAGRDDTRKK